MGKKKSLVWRFFSAVPNTSKVKCSFCKEFLTYCKSTTSLRTHLQVQHGTEWADAKQPNINVAGASGRDADDVVNDEVVDVDDPPTPDPEPDPAVAGPSTSQAGAETSTTAKQPKRPSVFDIFQQKKKKKKPNEDKTTSTSSGESDIFKLAAGTTITSLFEKQKSMTEGHAKWSKLVEALIYMIAKDLLSFKTVEHVGFRKFMSLVAPLWKVPSRKTLVKLVEKKFNYLKGRVKKVIQNVILSLTSDVWTDETNTRSYLSLTGHYLDMATCSMKYVLLGVEPLEDRHTADYLSNCINKMLLDWEIKHTDVFSATTDNGANIVRAVKDLLGERKHISCFAHSLNLVVSKAIENCTTLYDLILKVKAIVTYMKRNINAADMLRALQIEKGVPESEVLKLKQNVETRWNSTLDMLERYYALSSHVNSVLIHFDKVAEVIGPSELAVIKAAIKLLQPFKEATEHLCAEKYVTCSSVIPMIWCLKEELHESNPTLNPEIALKTQLEIQMEERFGFVEKERLLSVSTILDPRYKRLNFENPVAVTNALAAIQYLMKKVDSVQPEKTAKDNASDENEPRDKTRSLWHHHDRKKEKETSNSAPVELGGMPLELRQYLAEATSDKKANPLEVWKSNLKFKYPVLYQLAQKFLIGLATSVPSERLFSTTGLIMTKRRSSLKGRKLYQLSFLHAVDDSFWDL